MLVDRTRAAASARPAARPYAPVAQVLDAQVKPQLAERGGVAPPVLLPAHVRVYLDHQQRLGRCVGDRRGRQLPEPRGRDPLRPGMPAPGRCDHRGELVPRCRRDRPGAAGHPQASIRARQAQQQHLRRLQRPQHAPDHGLGGRAGAHLLHPLDPGRGVLAPAGSTARQPGRCAGPFPPAVPRQRATANRRRRSKTSRDADAKISSGKCPRLARGAPGTARAGPHPRAARTSKPTNLAGAMAPRGRRSPRGACAVMR